MFWWMLGAITAVIVVGYVAHKYPALFGRAVNTGADVVNKLDDQIKDSLNKQK